MISLKCISPWRSRFAFPLPTCSFRPARAYSWQKSSTLQNSSSKLIFDTSCNGVVTCKDTLYLCQEVSPLLSRTYVNYVICRIANHSHRSYHQIVATSKLPIGLFKWT